MHTRIYRKYNNNNKTAIWHGASLVTVLMESVSGTAGNTPLLVTRNVEDDEVLVSHVWGGSVDEGTDCRKIFKVHVNVHACLKSKNWCYVMQVFAIKNNIYL